jgi:hypothetical protein
MISARLLLLAGLFAFPALAAPPPAPQTIVLVECRVDDLGLDNLPDNVRPSREWRNLDWHRDPKDFSLSCKRTVVPLEDVVAAMDPSVKPLASDFSDPNQCGHAGIMYSSSLKHEGWAVAAIGCPVPIKDDQGTPSDQDDVTIGWKLPDCPSWLTCRFSEDSI